MRSAARRPEFSKDYQTNLDDPTDPFYCLLHDNDHKYKVFYGGRGGRKSWSVAEAIVKRMAREKVRVVCSREYQNSIADSSHKLLVDTIYRLGMTTWFRTSNSTISSKAGSEVIYKGLHNNVEEVKSTEAVDIWWLEEGQTLSQLSLQTIGPTVRKAGGQIWITFNTKNKSDPVYKRFIIGKPKNAVIHLVNFDTNPYFTPELEEERQEALARIALADNDDERKQAQADYNWIWLGHPHELSNEIIFAGKWSEEAFPDDLWKKAPRLLMGEDFGFAQDPAAITRSFILEDVLYIEYEAYGTGLDFMGNMKENKGELEQLHDKIPGIREWPLKCDSSRPETISFLRGIGFNANPAEKWPGSVEDGIAHIRGFRKIVIHPRCKRTIWEATNYKYKVDRITGEVLPIIVDKNNHCWDAIRYSLDGYIQRRGDIGIWTRLGKGYIPQR